MAGPDRASIAGPTPDTIVYRKHWAVLLRAMLLPLVTVIATTWAALQVQQVGATILSANSWLWLIVAGLPLLALGWLLWRIGDWRNDVYILTNDRIIDEERKPLGFRVERREAPLTNIQNVAMRIPNPFAASLGFGDVVVETAGYGGGIVFRSVANPRRVLGEVSRRVEAVRSGAEARATQERRAELLDWFTVRDQLERLRIVSSPPQAVAGAPLSIEWRLGGVGAPVATRLCWDFVPRPDRAYRYATPPQSGGAGNYIVEMHAPLSERLYAAAAAIADDEALWSPEVEVIVVGFDLSYLREVSSGEPVTVRWRCQSALEACQLVWRSENGDGAAAALPEGMTWSAAFVMPETEAVSFQIHARARGAELWSAIYEVGSGAMAPGRTDSLQRGG